MPPAVLTRRLALGLATCLSVCSGVAAFAQQPTSPPAYLAVVEGTATIEREGEVQPAVRDMPFVAGDRLRTESGRVEIDFPDGTTIEVGRYSEVEAVTDTRVRLLAGTMDHLARRPEAAVSANYLPSDLRRYGPTFDQYGSWNYDATYGYVWYPSVAAEWRPYYYGSWSSVPSYGWTWIGLDAWSWPTHHYGRWGYGRNSWFWIPGRSWSTAWVSWGIAANYVSWCPLGFDGRPVFALNAGRPEHGWFGWTVMSRDRFGSRGHYANRDAIDPRGFDTQTPFVQTTRLPFAFGRDRLRLGTRTADAVSRPVPPRAIVVPPPVPAGAAVAAPRGTTSAAPRTTVDPVLKNSRPETPALARPRTANPYAPAVPRAVTPGARKVEPTGASKVETLAIAPAPTKVETPPASPVAAPVAKPVIPPAPSAATKPAAAEGGAMRAAPPPQARPAGGGTAAAKGESAPAKRPR